MGCLCGSIGIHMNEGVVAWPDSPPVARQVNILADAAWLALMNETRGCARSAYATGLFCYSLKRYTRARPQRGSQTMGLAELVLLAIGLSMDAFAVSICKGLGMKKINLKVAVVLGLFFGGFQAGMPVIGWALGSQFMGFIGPIDHWIAFILLAFIGGKMLWEAFIEDEDEGDGKDAEKIELGEYLILAIATSIDALAVGISFAALSVDIVPAVSLIGITTFIFSVAGVAIGHTFGARYEKPATIVGGVVLILIGLKILLEHLGILAI